MEEMILSPDRMENGVILAGDKRTVTFPESGGGVTLFCNEKLRKRYLIFFAEVLEEHSVTLDIMFYGKDKQKNDEIFNIRFGLMPKVKTLICIDFNWLDGGMLFPGSTPGQLKVVCHGGRTPLNKVGKVALKNYPCFHDIRISLTDFILTDERPLQYPLPDIKLIDEYGQYKHKEWNGKVHNTEELKSCLSTGFFEAEASGGSGKFGGCINKKLKNGTGFFGRIKKDNRWYLTDPEGYMFFSMGPDCVTPFSDCRIDGLEQFLDYLPDRKNAEYADYYSDHKKSFPGDFRGNGTSFNFTKLNLCRIFKENWYEEWKKLITGLILNNGMNSLGNWSDNKLFGNIPIPYVTSLPEFPTTKQLIFRDFPDVLSEEYQNNARICAQALSARKDDPYMIGYFLRNEPMWAFVDNLIIADEVLYNPNKTACRVRLVESLKEKYGTADRLNHAWNTAFSSFADLEEPIENASAFSVKASEDMHEFSKKLIRAYTEIPAKACKKADPNHMILGMRWAWISNPDLAAGWENFDVFSINCYKTDPTPALDNVAALGVDLPVIIGEFHFGALNGGLTATGLEGVRTQKDRGLAYRYYCERAAAHPNGAGCHYFQLYDQFALGRFDGENYNIGMLDICSVPYEEMLKYVRECGKNIYCIKDGSKAPTEEKAQSIPMIAY